MSNYINSLSFKDLPDESEKIWLRPSEIGGKALNRKTNPKISVVVCTYNRDQMLPECLESLSNQRVDKNLYEVIVVDNNSKDNTQEVANGFVRKYSNFRYLFEPEQ